MKKIFLAFFFVILPLVSHAYQAAVVSANPKASEIGIDIIKKGGNAADAAVATAFALGVAEPFYSGIGGGGFLLYYDAQKKEFSFLDYRETAPAATTKQDPKKFQSGITSVGIPGFIKGMSEINRVLGKTSWNDLMAPAINLAKEGIPISGKLSEKISENQSTLEKDPDLSSIFVTPFKKGVSVKQDELANTLALIQSGGENVFYKGILANELAAYMKKNGGLITTDDLKNYTAHWRKPSQFTKDSYEITSAPIPSSGGAGLSLLFRKAIIYKANKERPYSTEAYQRLLNGIRDYFDYRDAALGDSDYNIIAHTTHISVIDNEGNMAAMTNTLNSPFGSGLIATNTGIILNDELSDFSTNPKSPNRPIAGRRPLSSMSPTIVFKNNKPFLVLGTPGGLTIPQNLFQILFITWDWKALFTQAIAQPKIYYSPVTKGLVAEKKFPKRILENLETDQPIEMKDSIGNVQALMIRTDKQTSVFSDPRGEGKGFTFSKK